MIGGGSYAGISIAVIPFTCLLFWNCTMTWQMKNLCQDHSTSVHSSFSCFSIVIFSQLSCLAVCCHTVLTTMSWCNHVYSLYDFVCNWHGHAFFSNFSMWGTYGITCTLLIMSNFSWFVGGLYFCSLDEVVVVIMHSVFIFCMGQKLYTHTHTHTHTWKEREREGGGDTRCV
jgi:hypothetical protein